MTRIGVVLGTGPSLSDVADDIRELKADNKIMLFGINLTYRDFDVDCLICCDPSFHAEYSPIHGDFTHWHWDKAICEKYGYKYIRGEWDKGLSTDKDHISFGHSSGWQALNLAVTQYECDKVLLVGYDMTYRADEPRHYFTDVSDKAGEYPQPLRKYSKFDKGKDDGLLWNYRNIADQCERGEICPIINCTPRSAMTWFPMGNILEHT